MIHKIDQQLLNGPMVHVVGAGGNGSMLLPHLARIDLALRSLGRTLPLRVMVFDPDDVEESNLGRQAYSRADLGRNKAVISVERTNLFFGTKWQAVTKKYFEWDYSSAVQVRSANIIITCTDNLESRRQVRRAILDGQYWLDLGNTNTKGQVILGGCGLPALFDLHPELLTAKEDTTTPSCSVAESLARQDLFINPLLANLAGQLLWTLLRKGELSHHGFYANLESGRVTPIPIPNGNTQTDNPTNNHSRIRSGGKLGIQRSRARTRKRAVR